MGELDVVVSYTLKDLIFEIIKCDYEKSYGLAFTTNPHEHFFTFGFYKYQITFGYYPS
jgi:hypothetical protein